MTDNQDTRAGRIVAFGNQKGGVTKTSTIVNLAAALSEMGQRVLVWDLDVNCGSTRLFGLPGELNVYGTYEVMTGDEEARDVIVQPGDFEQVSLPENVHLIPAHTKLEGIEAALAAKHGPFAVSHDALREPLDSIAGDYDFVFLDTSPSMTPPTKAAYMAAQYFVLDGCAGAPGDRGAGQCGSLHQPRPQGWQLRVAADGRGDEPGAWSSDQAL